MSHEDAIVAAVDVDVSDERPRVLDPDSGGDRESRTGDIGDFEVGDHPARVAPVIERARDEAIGDEAVDDRCRVGADRESDTVSPTSRGAVQILSATLDSEVVNSWCRTIE